MIRTLLENNVVPDASISQTAEELEKEYQKRQLEIADRYKRLVDDKLMLENSLSETDISSDDNDFSQEDALKARHEFNSELDIARDEVQDFNNELALLKKYGDDFAYLHRIKKIEDCSNEGVNLEMVEISKDYARGTNTDDSYFADLANGTGVGKNIALKVSIDDETPDFYLSLQQHDNPVNGKREHQLKIAMDSDDVPNLSKDNLQKILAFCESHGFSTLSADFPFSFDGIENEDKFHSLLNELQHEANKREEIARKHQEKLDADLLKEEVYSSTSQNDNVAEDYSDTPITGEPSSADRLYQNFATSNNEDKSFWEKLKERVKKPFVRNHSNNNSSKKDLKIKRKKFEETLEKKMFEEALGKERNMSYFKGHVASGIFGSSWTVYTFFDSPDKNNMAENGRKDKNGKPKYTYSFKLFVTQDSEGGLHFAYHMRDNKKVSEDMVNALVGQFKDAGLTHIRFPKGVPDSDKKIWRIALAEKGIVPIGMSIDRAKAQGMLEAAKKKLSDEAYAKYKFRLGLQMKENYEKKGKEPDTSEKEYIDSLIISHYYEPFAGAYGAVLKGGMSQKLRAAGKDPKMSAVKKVAIYYAFNRLFSVYDSEVQKGTIAQSPELNDVEKRRIKDAGLDIEPHKLSKEQMVELYELLLPRCMKEADRELEEAFLEAKDVGNVAAKGAKRADNMICKEIFDAARNSFEDVNERLKNCGCDEINMPKVMGRLQYDAFYDKHPEFLRRNTNTNTAPAPAPTNTHNNGGNSRNP